MVANWTDIILDHIGCYTISIKLVVETLYAELGNAGTMLNKLVEEGFVQRISHGLDGNYSYYQLTTKGAKFRGLPINRAREKEAKGLAQDLAALWFSCLGEYRRRRLGSDELRQLFGAPRGGNIIHVAQDADDETTVYRLFVPSATSSLSAFLPTLKKSAHDATGEEKLLGWVERGTYRLAVLVHNEDRREDLTRLVKDEDFPNIRIEVDIAPTPSTLGQFINTKKETR